MEPVTDLLLLSQRLSMTVAACESFAAPPTGWGFASRTGSERIETASLQLAAQAGGEPETRQDRQGMPRPVHIAYQAVCYCTPEPDMPLRLGLRGRGRVTRQPITCAQRLGRFVQQRFRFR